MKKKTIPKGGNRMSQTHLSNFSTKDIYLASVIKVSGIPIVKVENNGRGQGIFVFKPSGEIEELIRKYFNNELRVDPRSLFENWKALKSMAFASIGDVR